MPVYTVFSVVTRTVSVTCAREAVCRIIASLLPLATLLGRARMMSAGPWMRLLLCRVGVRVSVGTATNTGLRGAEVAVAGGGAGADVAGGGTGLAVAGGAAEVAVVGGGTRVAVAGGGTGVDVFVGVLVAVGLAVGVLVGVLVEVGMSVAVGVSVGVSVAVGVSVGAGYTTRFAVNVTALHGLLAES